MGEVVVSSEGGMELEAQGTEVETEMAQQAEARGSGAAAEEEGSSMVRWERFLPKMVVRVLLVEADDSTRQIIAALLRKCSYKGSISSSNHSGISLILVGEVEFFMFL